MQGSPNIVGRGLNKLRRAAGEDEEEGIAQDLEVVKQGEATEAVIPDRHIVPRKRGSNRNDGGREAEEVAKVQED